MTLGDIIEFYEEMIKEKRKVLLSTTLTPDERFQKEFEIDILRHHRNECINKVDISKLPSISFIDFMRIVSSSNSTDNPFKEYYKDDIAV